MPPDSATNFHSRRYCGRGYSDSLGVRLKLLHCSKPLRVRIDGFLPYPYPPLHWRADCAKSAEHIRRQFYRSYFVNKSYTSPIAPVEEFSIGTTPWARLGIDRLEHSLERRKTVYLCRIAEVGTGSFFAICAKRAPAYDFAAVCVWKRRALRHETPLILFGTIH